jgi:hypothetical protein
MKFTVIFRKAYFRWFPDFYRYEVLDFDWDLLWLGFVITKHKKATK